VSYSEPIPDVHLLLRESDWLLRLARGLCSDRGLAEDLRQDALLAAWKSRGKVRGPWRPWLAGVVRRLTANRQRAEVRRQRRESAVAHERTAPGADEVVARAGLHRSVVDAVMELDEPYRTGILLRYFDDLSAREIGERLGVPVETVRTRIKRGVALLRARLDREHGSRGAWAGPLLGMVEMGLPGAGVGAGLMAVGSFLVMHAKLVVAVVLVAGIAFLSFWPEARATLPDVAGEPEPVVAKTLADESRALEAEPEAAAEPTRVVSPDVAGFHVRGYVVAHADGKALPRASVRLLATERVFEPGRVLRSLAELRVAPAISVAKADAGGRFEVAMQTETPLTVVVFAEGYAPVVSRSYRMATGAVLDLGEVRLHGAVRIAGQVRDVSGAAVPDVVLRLTWRGQFDRKGDWLPCEEVTGGYRTDHDGRFVAPGIGRAGTWWITFDDPNVNLVQETTSFRELAPGSHFLDLRVDRGLGQLRGVVVDAEGEPVAGVTVGTIGGRCMASTRDDGSFVLERRRGTKSRFGLRVWRSRFRRSEVIHETDERFTWGQDDVRLVVPRGVDLELQVVQAPSMQPVEVFELDMQRVGAPMWGPGGIPQGSGTSRQHPNGLVQLPGLVPGRYRVVVVQPRQSDVVELQVLAGADGRQRLVVPAAQQVTVRLRDASGRAVVGSRVDLMREGPERPHLCLDMQPTHRQTEPGGVNGLPSPCAIYRVAGGQSDEQGRVDLPVPARGDLLLRVSGRGHAPLVYRGDLRPSSGVVEVTVTRGVTLRGKLEPQSIVSSQRSVSLCLQSLEHSGQVFPARFTHIAPGLAGSIVQPDGTFELTNVPPGRWRVYLSYLAPARGAAAVYQLVPVTELTLEPGKDRSITLDCKPASPVEVRGQAMFRGHPAKLARLDLSGPPVLGQRLFGAFDCDADGRFAGKLLPGTYRVKAVVQVEPSGKEIACEYPAVLTVKKGGAAWPTLDLFAVAGK